MAGLACLGAAGAGPAMAVAPSAGAGGWGQAIQVPGTAALNKGGNANITSVSCPAAGSCAAVGFYHAGSGRGQAFVVTETNGRWRTAIKVPGLAALNGGSSDITSVSCTAADSCAAIGDYVDGSSHLGHAFVVSKRG